MCRLGLLCLCVCSFPLSEMWSVPFGCKFIFQFIISISLRKEQGSVERSCFLCGQIVSLWHVFRFAEILEGYKAVTVPSEEDKKSQRSLYAQLEAVADMKFTYVATCQNYGNQKRSGDRHATDILNLMVKYVLSDNISGLCCCCVGFYLLISFIQIFAALV